MGKEKRKKEKKKEIKKKRKKEINVHWSNGTSLNLTLLIYQRRKKVEVDFASG